MRIKIFCTILFTVGVIGQSNAQVNVYGPDCVNTATVYQYKITGTTNASTVQVCVSGGQIRDSVGTTTTCKTFTGRQLILLVVEWSAIGSASVTVAPVGAGAYNKQVNVTNPLSAGIISGNSQSQSISRNTLASMITCSPATGGICEPEFRYQWQQSANRINWTDINNAITQNLEFKTVLSQSKYYRRRVTESKSGAIAYSDIAAIHIVIRQGETARFFKKIDNNDRYAYNAKRIMKSLNN